MPGSRKDRSNQGRYPCVVCSTQVTIHQKALQCDNCDEWTHFKCTPLTCDEYSNLARSSKDWYCGNCETICGGGGGGGGGEVNNSSRTSLGGEESVERVELGETNERVELTSGSEDEDVNGGSGDHDTDNTGIAHPSEELLVLLEDDFIKNLGNLVDVLKLKFEQIHTMQQRNKELETDNRSLRQQLSDKSEEVQTLQQRLSLQAEPQAEIRRLNSIIRGLRDSTSRHCETSAVGGGRQMESLVDRQGRMATVLGRMTNFLSGLSEDLTRTDNFMPTPPSSTNVPSRPSSADSHNTDRPKPKRRIGKRHRRAAVSVRNLLQKTEQLVRHATSSCRYCSEGQGQIATSRSRDQVKLPPAVPVIHTRGRKEQRLPTSPAQSIVTVDEGPIVVDSPTTGEDESTRCDVTIVTLVTDERGNMRVVNQAKGTVEEKSALTPDKTPYSPSNDIRRIVHTYIEQCSNPSDTPVDSSPWIHTPSNRTSPWQQPCYSGFVHQLERNEELNDLNVGGTSNGRMNISVSRDSNSSVTTATTEEESTPLEITTRIWNGAEGEDAGDTAHFGNDTSERVAMETVGNERFDGVSALRKRVSEALVKEFASPILPPAKGVRQSPRGSTPSLIGRGRTTPAQRGTTPSLIGRGRTTPAQGGTTPHQGGKTPFPTALGGAFSPVVRLERSLPTQPHTKITVKKSPKQPSPKTVSDVKTAGSSRVYNITKTSPSSRTWVTSMTESPEALSLKRSNVIVEVPMDIDVCDDGRLRRLSRSGSTTRAGTLRHDKDSDAEISFPKSTNKRVKASSPDIMNTSSDDKRLSVKKAKRCLEEENGSRGIDRSNFIVTEPMSRNSFPKKSSVNERPRTSETKNLNFSIDVNRRRSHSNSSVESFVPRKRQYDGTEMGDVTKDEKLRMSPVVQLNRLDET